MYFVNNMIFVEAPAFRLLPSILPLWQAL